MPIFGEVSATNAYVAQDELTAADTLGHEIERLDGQAQVGIMEVTSGVHTGWTSRTLWGFESIEGRRHLCKFAITIKDDQKASARMVFDYLGTPEGM